MNNLISKITIGKLVNALLFFIALLPVAAFSQGFYISGNQLRDANGNNFIMKGFAVPTAWFVSDVNSNITNMKNKTGANCMRIVCTTGMNDNDWKTTVQNCINNKVVPMIELHDATCLNDWNRLNDMAKYWAARASYLTSSGISKYILINIANEWGDGSQSNSNWREAYKTAITTIRNAGINTTLVVDAPGCGQDTYNASTMRTYWSDLQNYDPRHNLLFSVHMYGVWATNSNNSTVETGIQYMRDAGMPFIVGEFADQGSWGDYDETKVLSKCNAVGAGWLAWSWKGNSEPILDMSNDWAGTSLKTWGNTAVNGAYGTKTAATASVFNGSSGGTIANGTYKISFRHSNLSLNVEGNSTADGGNVVQWGYNNGANEQWYVKSQGNSQYSILNVNSGRGLDVSGASTADGADINQWYYSGGNNQKWRIESLGSGYYRIVNVNSGKCIDMPGSSTTAGTSINQYTCNGGNNQSFYLTQLGTYAGRPAIVQNNPVQEDAKLVIYPNPSSGAFNVNTSGTYTYTIYNAAGAAVEKGTGRGKAAVGAKLHSGAYVLKVDSQKASKNFKLIKN